MHFNFLLAVAGVFVGFTVGLTGMGGGALMTPILVLLFKVDPLTAVSSDVVASLVMKPIGGSVHLRRGGVNLTLVRWLCVGSVPSAFAGVLLLNTLGSGTELQDRLKIALGATLLVASISIVIKSVIATRRHTVAAPMTAAEIKVKVLPTVAIGVFGGLVVGMTSVGSGSLMIVLLLFLYPRLVAGQLVGTDLVQAIPLVASAALGHILFGDFELGITASLLAGAIPGVYLGARASTRAPDSVIRPILLFVLVVSALKLLGLSNIALAWVVMLLLVAIAGIVMVRRRRGTGSGPPDPQPTRQAAPVQTDS